MGPAKINFFVLMTLLGVGLIVLIVYSLVTPSIEECLLQRANEDISNACWNLLLQRGARLVESVAREVRGYPVFLEPQIAQLPGGNIIAGENERLILYAKAEIPFIHGNAGRA